MRKTTISIILILCASLAVSGINCKDVKKYGDENGQTLCPVMGNTIDKIYYADYKGKRIYFCCPACIEPFNKEPEKYMKILEGVKLDDAPAVK